MSTTNEMGLIWSALQENAICSHVFMLQVKGFNVWIGWASGISSGKVGMDTDGVISRNHKPFIHHYCESIKLHHIAQLPVSSLLSIHDAADYLWMTKRLKVFSAWRSSTTLPPALTHVAYFVGKSNLSTLVAQALWDFGFWTLLGWKCISQGFPENDHVA